MITTSKELVTKFYYIA